MTDQIDPTEPDAAAARLACVETLKPGLNALRSPVWVAAPGVGVIWANHPAQALDDTAVKSDPAAAVAALNDGRAVTDPSVIEAVADAVTKGRFALCRWLIAPPGGEALTVRVSPAPGGLATIESVLTADAEALRRREKDLADKASALEATLQTMSQAVSIYDVDMRLSGFNRRWVEILKVPPHLAQVGARMIDVVRCFARRGDYGPGVNIEAAAAAKVAGARVATSGSEERRLWDGTICEVSWRRMSDGRLMYTYSDITALRESERERAAKSVLLETTLQNIAQGLSVVDKDMRLAAWNDRFIEMFRYPDDFVHVGRSFIDLLKENLRRLHGVEGDGLEAMARAQAELIAAGRAEPAELVTPTGRIVEIRRSVMPDGGLVSTYLDVTDRIRANQALMEREARLNAILANVVDGVITLDDAGRIETWNDAAAGIFGWRSDEASGRGLDLLIGGPPTDDPRKALGPALRRSTERMALRRDGTQFPMEWAATEVRLRDRGLIIVTLRDVTERRETEERLRQSQKMEAVGQLTGGIAHDFNNLLTVILGNLQWMEDKLADRPTLSRQLKAAVRAATRGADLTQRLLAFSRRQTLKPEPTNANELIANSCLILSRTLGEAIRIDQTLAPDLWTTRVDRGQMEDALLNLAINARDAMPQGGAITIVTRNAALTGEGDGPDAPVGEFVSISVSDEGMGMSPEVLARAFEPFFTTKAAGRGTGLGLSQVYGFVRQSGGHVRLDSAPGAGATVTIFLPRAAVALGGAGAAPTEAENLGHGETILVVEDDEDVRSVAVMWLNELGYRVRAAGNGEEALAVLDHSGAIDLIFTDMVLGGMTGAKLAGEARARRPGQRVLLTSGYAADVYAAEGDLVAGDTLLAKPYSHAQLAGAVRKALEA